MWACIPFLFWIMTLNLHNSPHTRVKTRVFFFSVDVLYCVYLSFSSLTLEVIGLVGGFVYAFHPIPRLISSVVHSILTYTVFEYVSTCSDNTIFFLCLGGVWEGSKHRLYADVHRTWVLYDTTSYRIRLQLIVYAAVCIFRPLGYFWGHISDSFANKSISHWKTADFYVSG